MVYLLKLHIIGAKSQTAVGERMCTGSWKEAMPENWLNKLLHMEIKKMIEFDYEKIMKDKELIIDAYIKAGEDKKDENL
jgi:hypothetical protein